MDHGTDDLMREMEKDTARPRRPRRRRRRRQDTVGYEEADFDTLFGDGIVCVESARLPVLGVLRSKMR